MEFVACHQRCNFFGSELVILLGLNSLAITLMPVFHISPTYCRIMQIFNSWHDSHLISNYFVSSPFGCCKCDAFCKPMLYTDWACPCPLRESVTNEFQSEIIFKFSCPHKFQESFGVCKGKRIGLLVPHGKPHTSGQRKSNHAWFILKLYLTFTHSRHINCSSQKKQNI